MLPFHKAIHEQVTQTDSLHVLGRGLGMHLAAAYFIASNVNDDSIIIGLNISRQLASALIWPTLQSAIHTVSDTNVPLLLPRFLSADYTIRDRINVYNTSGFVITTSAVLVHDLLHHTLPVDRVQGIVIFAADTIKERSNEHFALNLFRMKNRTAFIKAFSENPQALSRGFHSAEKLMRQLYISTICLWPRFHKKIRNSLQSHVPDLIDLSVELTFRMSALLVSLRDTIFAILDDLRIATHAIDFSELYRSKEVDADGNPSGKKILVPNFNDCVRRQLEGADIRSTSKVKSLLSDLTILRSLLKDVFELNAVHFYQRIVTIRHTMAHNSSWLFRKEAQRAIFMARSRVWTVRKASATEALETDDKSKEGDPVENDNNTHSTAPLNVGPGTITIATLEPSPKWKALREVLSEIQSDIQTAGPSADVNRVLILVRHERIVTEIESVLKNGEQAYLRKQFRNVFPAIAVRSHEYSRREGQQKLQMTMTQLALPEEQRRPTAPAVPEKMRQNGRRRNRVNDKRQKSPHVQNDDDMIRQTLEDVFREIPSNNTDNLQVVIWCAEWVDIQGRGHRILDEYRPSFVILYNTDLALVRQVEVYKALHPGRPVRMYILAYEDAVEEEQFRQSSSREKESFKTLIRERATMTILENQEGKEPEMMFTQSLLNETQGRSSFGSRRGLGSDHDSRLSAISDSKKVPSEKNVLVDTRELRSALPMLLHQSSLKIVPITLEVGDFILSRDIGIERKSVPDLYGSFGSGRLFNQAEALCRHYKNPCLLIELDPSKPVSLTATSGGVPSEIVATSIVSKVVLLLQQFPNFRLLWAKGPHDAAELFIELKENESEPDEQIAASLGVDTKESSEEQYNAGPKALLRSLPGIDSQNLVSVMRKVKSVATLLSMSKQEMTEVLGSEGKAMMLYEFANEAPTEALAAIQ